LYIVVSPDYPQEVICSSATHKGDNMIRQQYANFVEGFGDLNPYELDHLSEALLVKFEELLLNSGKEESMQHSLNWRKAI
jgi:hypothetical protein